MGTLRKRGFSLIELLVVIVVLATLISLVLPVLAGTREASMRVKCASNLRSLATAVTFYKDAHRDAIPVAENPWNIATGLVPEVVSRPFEALRSELGDPVDWRGFGPAHCPSDKRIGPFIGFGYFYIPSAAFGFLSLMDIDSRSSRIREVQALYREGTYDVLWRDIDQGAHAGRRQAVDLLWQTAFADCSVRLYSRPGFGEELGDWIGR